MRPRVLLSISLGLNLGLGALILTAHFFQRLDVVPAPGLVRPPSLEPRPARTNLVVRRENFTWHDIESADYRTYILKLRAFGCPEDTIRDIIVAEVNGLYDRKRAEVNVPEQEWWRSEPNQNHIKAAAAQFEQLDAERRTLLADLLGPNWEQPNTAALAEFNLRLDGPILSAINPKTKQALREIETRALKRRQGYFDAQGRSGQAQDPAELERLRQQTRQELAQILTPQQLEEYLLRYSQTAESIRSQFQGFDLTPDEFRGLFRARDALDQQIQMASGSDPASVARRAELERQRDALTQQSLGTERFQLYLLSQDPLFRQAQASAEKVGASAEAVVALYQINQATELETQRIRNDQTLSLEDRARALAIMVERKEESLRKILGEAAYLRYREQVQQ